MLSYANGLVALASYRLESGINLLISSWHESGQRAFPMLNNGFDKINKGSHSADQTMPRCSDELIGFATRSFSGCQGTASIFEFGTRADLPEVTQSSCLQIHRGNQTPVGTSPLLCVPPWFNQLCWMQISRTDTSGRNIYFSYTVNIFLFSLPGRWCVWAKLC